MFQSLLNALVTKKILLEAGVFFIFFIAILVIQSNKAFFLVCFLFFFVQFFLQKGNIIKTLILTFIPFYVFAHVGQWYGEEIIPGTLLTHEMRYEGRNIDFVFSPYTVWTLVSLSTFCYLVFFMSSTLKNKAVLIILTGLVSFAGLTSALQTPYLTQYAVLHYIHDIGPLWLLAICGIALPKLSSKEWERVLLIIAFQVACLLSLEFILSFIQVILITSHTIHISQAQKIVFEARGLDEIINSFRPSGTRIHPNFLAELFVEYFFSFTMVAIALRAYTNNIFSKFLASVGLPYVSIVSVLSLILLQARAGYLVLICNAIVLGWYFNVEMSIFIKKTKMMFLSLASHRKLIIYVIASIFLFIFSYRALSILYSFSPGGGGFFRWKMITEAFEVVSAHLWWGTGPGMYMAGLYATIPEGLVLDFPIEVHNHFLLVLAEYGVVFFILLGFYFYVLFREIMLQQMPKNMRIFMLLGIFSVFMFMNMHFFYYLLPLHIFVGYMVATYIKTKEPTA